MRHALEGIAPLLTQLERERQERISAARVAALAASDRPCMHVKPPVTSNCRHCKMHITWDGYRWIHTDGIGIHEAEPPKPSPLAQCAAHHEREAARYHALRASACAADDAALARSMGAAELMHAGFAVACREADDA